MKPAWVALCAVCLIGATADRTAGGLLSGVKQATGGSRWDAARTLHIQGAVTMGELRGSYEEWLDLRHLYSYVDMRFSHPALGTMRDATGWNGKVAWEADQTGDVCIAESAQARKDALTSAYLDAFSYLRGVPTVEAPRSQVLRISPPDTFPFELSIDPATHRVTRSVPLTGADRDVTTYSDYREVAGLVLPFRVEELVNDSRNVLMTRTASFIEVDRDPPAGIFDNPPAVETGLEFPNGKDTVSLDFRFENGSIYLPVSINGRLDNFVFDTGMTDTIDARRAKALGLKVVNSGVAYGGGTEAAPAGFAKVDRLEIGGLKLENQILDTTILPGTKSVPVDGGIGYQLAKRCVIAIDFGAKRITLTKPESFRPPPDAIRLPLRFASQSEIVVEGTVDGFAGDFQLDTGDGGSLHIGRPFAERTGLLQKYAGGKKSIAQGVGGKAGVVAFTPSEFALGGLTPAVQPSAIFLSKTGGGAEQEIAGIVGIEILLQYKVTFDYPHNAVYFEKDPAFWDLDRWKEWIFSRPDPQKPNREGWLGFTKLHKDPGQPIEILEVKGGPAARAGIKKGDGITAINGAASGALTAEQIFDAIMAAPGTKVKLSIRHGDQTREITLITE